MTRQDSAHGTGVHVIRMPQLGETVDEGTVTSWLKGPGEQVSEREPVLEVSTDKVDTEIESTVAGVLARILVDEGATVPVGTVLAEISTPGAPAAPGTPGTAPLRPEDLLLSPRVRRLIDEHAVDIGELAVFATRPEITRRTVEAYLAGRTAAASTSSEGGSEDNSDGTAEGPTPDGRHVVAFTRIRRLTAEHMVASKATSPHVATAIEADFEAVAQVRREHRERLRGERGAGLTYLPFVACATARALDDFERLNASVEGDTLVLHPSVHLGIAVDLDGAGLIVPVVRDAQRLTLAEMTGEIQRVAELARADGLRPDDVSGGTFTVTGQGPYGTLLTVPIIHQPQLAIVSVDGVAKRPVVEADEAGNDRIGIRHTGVLTMSWDHRAVDGAYAAAFLAAVRDRVANLDWAAEL
ncbi:MAG: dihydrolipoamide acetyltransferase family protein [Carbonactinosporaceae bacterium]